jgi:hypothetical protein
MWECYVFLEILSIYVLYILWDLPVHTNEFIIHALVLESENVSRPMQFSVGR